MKSTNDASMVCGESEPKFQVGDYVRWYEAYADGFLGRDAGFGVVTRIIQHRYYGDYVTYDVLRNKHGDVMCFAEQYLQTMKEFRNSTNRKKEE